MEESILPRLYREVPVNSIWEGSGNVMCLDVLRAAAKSPETLAAVFSEIDEARGGDARLDRFVADLRENSAQAAMEETGARHWTESLVLAFQAALLVRHGPAAVADAFCASRLAGRSLGAFGTLPGGLELGAILARAWPR